MNRKVDTAYFLNDPRKFDSVEQAEKELNRLRAVCIRLKKKQDEDITFLLGLSVTSSQWYGRMGYCHALPLGREDSYYKQHDGNSERRIGDYE